MKAYVKEFKITMGSKYIPDWCNYSGAQYLIPVPDELLRPEGVKITNEEEWKKYYKLHTKCVEYLSNWIKNDFKELYKDVPEMEMELSDDSDVIISDYILVKDDFTIGDVNYNLE